MMMMLLRLAALGTLGYVIYKFLVHRRTPPRPAVSGGPLADRAVLQNEPDQAPPAELYDDMA
jgi:hypothetical protein